MTDDAMTRSEEQLHVGTEQVEAGRARLRKHVVTEQQTVTVPVSHDEVRVVREPITDATVDSATAGPELSEEEHEVVLTEDRVVAAKETVPVERVSLGTETVTENRQVTEDVSHEEIELDDDGVTPRRSTDGH
ncbi:YsnF/AvaK domain-containing protein [Rathayibacter oskolensis]|uniref:YsnF/AvaK domain-containing protein n=1 Tax=Rathayibacter oskolensis TaxID=1891671 RepID=UPI003465147F